MQVAGGAWLLAVPIQSNPIRTIVGRTLLCCTLAILTIAICASAMQSTSYIYIYIYIYMCVASCFWASSGCLDRSAWPKLASSLGLGLFIQQMNRTRFCMRTSTVVSLGLRHAREISTDPELCMRCHTGRQLPQDDAANWSQVYITDVLYHTIPYNINNSNKEVLYDGNRTPQNK